MKPLPYYEHAGIMIYHGDCLKIMPTLADKSVDMILCDLPYGTTACKWDMVIPFEPLWKQYKRLVTAPPAKADGFQGQAPESSAQDSKC